MGRGRTFPYSKIWKPYFGVLADTHPHPKSWAWPRYVSSAPTVPQIRAAHASISSWVIRSCSEQPESSIHVAVHISQSSLEALLRVNHVAYPTRQGLLPLNVHNSFLLRSSNTGRKVGI